MARFAQRIPGLGRLLQVLGVNGVPAAGFLGDGWSVGTTLLLYWLETVMVIVLVSLRVVLHRRWTGRAGHWATPALTSNRDAGGRRLAESTPGDGKRRGRPTFLHGFLGVMVPFTLAHGLFVWIIALFVLPEKGGSSEAVSFEHLGLGLAGIAVLLVLGLLIDLVGLRERPFAWIERVTERAQGRMFLTHLTIIFGMGAMAMLDGPHGLFLVFAGLKLLGDLGGLFAKDEVVLEPEAPRWLRRLDRLGKQKDGKTFSEHYRDSVLADQAKREANEQVNPAPGAS